MAALLVDRPADLIVELQDNRTVSFLLVQFGFRLKAVIPS